MFLRTKSSKKGVVEQRSHASPPTPQPPGLALQITKIIRADAVNPFVEADVIDLGRPRLPRRRATRTEPTPAPRRGYVPNPRLYPGPRRPAAARVRRQRRQQRVLRRVVPNPRLYRPPPPRPPPPPAVPRATWLPPPPLRPHDTASRAALRLGERRAPRSPPAPPAAPVPAPPPSTVPVSESTRRLVVRLPARYEPTSENCVRKVLPTMEPTSPDEHSGGDEPLSAPSEFLAEFLSAIMRQQYAEALKYCRLILQYEPHNATARSFHPLLLRKLRRRRTDDDFASSSEDSSAAEAARPASSPGGGSASSQSSLELDSEPASHGDHSTDTDTNGNIPRPPLSSLDADPNDNAATASGDAPGATLRRLRAHFARSVK